MSTIYAIKRKLEAIRIHEHVNKPHIRLIMWRPGDPPATKKGEVWTLEKEERARPSK